MQKSGFLSKLAHYKGDGSAKSLKNCQPILLPQCEYDTYNEM